MHPSTPKQFGMMFLEIQLALTRYDLLILKIFKKRDNPIVGNH